MRRLAASWLLAAFFTAAFAQGPAADPPADPAAPESRPAAPENRPAAPENRPAAPENRPAAYAIRGLAPDAHLAGAGSTLAASAALQTALQINQFLAAGKIEEAALLSNTPRRRYEILRDYQRSVGEEGFRRVFAEYLRPDNRLVAEVTIGRRSLLVWHLHESNHFSGQFYVEIEGKFLMDDAPGEERSKLRRVLEDIRIGKILVPEP